ncbi:MAG: MarR family transcriptional regulator [Candidatus Sericytochromatia bacterium]|nr:MarR family transcriptional regulator [Candidatus Sericytochromatia bacterium]
MPCANRHIPTPHPERVRDVREENVILSLIKAYGHLQTVHHAVFREHGITAQQYNVLRILYVRGEQGLCSAEIAPLMTTRVPDMTRLLDRMARDGLLERVRSEDDRRMVKVFLCDKGRQICMQVDQPLVDSSREALKKLAPAEQNALKALLDKIYS